MSIARHFCLILLALLFTAASPAAAERIVAVGDIHGDYDAFVDIVRAAGLADDKNQWTGGDAILVQMGDITDRGPDSLKVIRFLETLEKSAPRKGGRVVALLGNHEAMNVTGDLRYVHPGEYAAFATRKSDNIRRQAFDDNKDAILARYRQGDPHIAADAARQRWMAETPAGMIEHRKAWAPRGKVGAWMLRRPAIARIGDTLFVHGGISIETSARPIEAINAEVSARLAEGESQKNSILTDELGPLWYRGHVLRDPVPPPVEGKPPAPQRIGIEDEIAQVLATYRAKRLVIAHTPNLSGILANFGGRLVRIDTGISAYYHGARSYFEIKDGRAMAWKKTGGGQWISQDVPSPQ